MAGVRWIGSIKRTNGKGHRLAAVATRANRTNHHLAAVATGGSETVEDNGSTQSGPTVGLKPHASPRVWTSSPWVTCLPSKNAIEKAIGP